MSDTHFALKHFGSKLLLLVAVLAMPAMTVQSAQAQTETVLYSFNNKDGALPNGSLISDSQGNLYGTTFWGGIRETTGVVFQLTPAGTENILYRFGSYAGGWEPNGGLVFDSEGNLYGTTFLGGISTAEEKNGQGGVFRLTPAHKEKLIYKFTGGADGSFPAAGLSLDAQGKLYGTTECGGDQNCYEPPGYPSGCGTVFEVSPAAKGRFQEKALYAFGGMPDATNPVCSLLRDSNGNLYGTTPQGGYLGWGTAFELTSAGKETIFYEFGEKDGPGNGPANSLIMDAQGNFYGATEYNGEGGAVFQLTPSGTVHLLYTFTGGADGAYPTGPLVMDEQGNLYGTTQYGGIPTGHLTCGNVSGCGVVFKLTPDGTETVLYSFLGRLNNNTDGAVPNGGLLRDEQGNLYGTTQYGGSSSNCGSYGCGTVFKITP